MTDIIASPAVKEAVKIVMEQQERLGKNAAEAVSAADLPGASQPIRASVLRAAQLAHEAEDHARNRQHVKGKLTARERLDLLLDTGSFEEIGRFCGGDINGGRAGAAVITGFGEVFGRKVAVYAQDFSVRGGTLGVAEGRKICRLMDKALDLKVPIIALIDSGGARIQEGVAALTQYGHLFRKTCDASGFVPQLSLILGPCAGGAVYCPALTDLIIMTRENSNMFVTGPDVVKAATGEVISMDDLGGGYVHNATSGVAHYLGEDEADAIDYARTVLAYLPSNSDLQPPTYAYAATRADRDVAKRLATIVPDNDRQPYDVLDVIRCLVDYGEFVQVHELFAQAPPSSDSPAWTASRSASSRTSRTSTPAALDVDSSEKVARFVRLCDAFNLPVVTLVDTPGYKPGAEQEHAGIIRRGAKVIYAYANAQVPLVTVILRKAYGGAYIVMGSKAIGADLNYAWPIQPDRRARRGRSREHHPPQGPAESQGRRSKTSKRSAPSTSPTTRTHHRQRESVAGDRPGRRHDRPRADPRGPSSTPSRLLATKTPRAPHRQAPRQPAALGRAQHAGLSTPDRVHLLTRGKSYPQSTSAEPIRNSYPHKK